MTNETIAAQEQDSSPADGKSVLNDWLAMQSFKDAEQSAFEKWLTDKSPSGDVESVRRQWLQSYEYAELLDEQEPEWQNDIQAAFGGIVQTPQG